MLLLLLASASLQNFGLDYHAFQHMVGDCPPDFLQLAFDCCNVSTKLIQSVAQRARLCYANGHAFLFDIRFFFSFFYIARVGIVLSSLQMD